jgi:2'-5' RNA ligase
MSQIFHLTSEFMTDQLYFIATIPTVPLRDKIQQLKLEVKEKFNSSHSLNAPPHITLLSPFRMNEELEDNLDSLLEVFAQGFQPFKVQLNDFSTFPPRVVFIDVKKKSHLKSFSKNWKKQPEQNRTCFPTIIMNGNIILT